jgi:hypothetical protein
MLSSSEFRFCLYIDELLAVSGFYIPIVIFDVTFIITAMVSGMLKISSIIFRYLCDASQGCYPHASGLSRIPDIDITLMVGLL